MRRLLIAAVPLLALSVACARNVPKLESADETSKDLKARYKQVKRQYETAMQEFARDYQKATTEEEEKKLANRSPQPEKYAERILQLVEKEPTDPAAVEALITVIGFAGDTPAGRKAADLILKDYLTSPQLFPVCETLAYARSPDSDKLLRAIIEKNPHRSVKGVACLGLARYLKRQVRDEKVSEEAEKLFERVADNYGEVLGGDAKPLGDVAIKELFEIRFLSIGKVAPEIEGEDLNGEKMKLSDYRGKVVVLDFWGNW
jgi:hypothetical protein